jgi:hypothetical protein
MKPATTVQEAAIGAFQTYQRDVWDPESRFPAADVYTDRVSVGGAGPQPSRPFIEIRRRLLRSSDAQRLVLSGQIGAGKSMELYQLSRDPDVRESREVVSLSLADRLNLQASVNIRLVLLALAHELAHHLVAEHGQRTGKWGWVPVSHHQKVLEEWLRVLANNEQVEPPPKFEAEPFILKLDAGLASKTVQVRSDDAVRQALASDDSFAPSQLRNLVESLMTWTEQLAERPLLLLIDDGDKIGDSDAARDVFVRNVHLLLDLPASIVLTVPFWMHFDADFGAARRGASTQLLPNIKVVSREQRDVLAEPGSRFFWALYDKLASRDIIDAAAFDLAAITSAGVPREFIRILSMGFDLADERGLARLDLPTLRLALATLKRELLAVTQNKLVREALARIHQTNRLDNSDDWRLLNTLLVVEYTNDEPWYDTNPLLVDEAARWAAETAVG